MLIYKVIKQTLFFTNYGFYPTIYKTSVIGLNNLYTVIKIEYLKFLYNRLKNELLFVKDRMIKYYNIKKMKGLFFEKGGKVYLFYKNIIIKQSNDKLDYKKLGPFIIIRKISE